MVGGSDRRVCGDCKHWHAEDGTPYDGTCTAPIPQWLCDWVAGQRLSLRDPCLWSGEYEADECEAFEEGEA